METSQRRRFLSSEAETRKRESEEKARSETPCSWPTNWWEVEKARESELREKVLRVLSAEEEARRRPLEENLTAEMARSWGVRVWESV